MHFNEAILTLTLLDCALRGNQGPRTNHRHAISLSAVGNHWHQRGSGSDSACELGALSSLTGDQGSLTTNQP